MSNPSRRDVERRLEELDAVDGPEGPGRVTFNSYLVDQDGECVGQFHRLTVDRDGREWESSEKYFDVSAE